MEFISLSAQRLRIGDRIDRAIARVLDHGRFVLGPEVAELEESLQEFCGARYCITCANGTDALELVLAALDIGPGDAVIVPAFSFVASAEAVVRVGATPVFADVEAATFNICPTSAEAAIRAAQGDGLSVRCIMPVDLFGQSADYASIHRLAKKYDLKILSDSAQSFGATWRGRQVGSLADATTTSFYPSKPLGCYGDGGAVFTNNPTLASMVESLRCHGQSAPGGAIVRVGRNSRLDTIQAAILLEKLSVFDEEIDARNRVAKRYADRLPEAVIVPKIAAGNRSVWAQYTVQISGIRDEVAAACRAVGVPTAIHYATPLHLLPAYRHFPRAAAVLKQAETLSKTVLSLPMHADLDERTQDRVIEAVEKAVAAHSPQMSCAHA